MRVNDKEIQNYDRANYFWSLVRTSKKAKRKCPACGIVKVSMNAGDRYCSQCERRNVGVLGTYYVDFKEVTG